MYTLKGIFPEPKKDQKKNFIKENMKQLKFMQGKSKEPRLVIKSGPSRQSNTGLLGQVSSSPSNRSGKATLAIGKSSSMNSRKNRADVRIKKGDMAEFLKRKEMRQIKPTVNTEEFNDDSESVESSGRLRDIGCQTVDINLAQKLAESTKLTMLYPKEGEIDSEGKSKASGDGTRQKNANPYGRGGEADMIDSERNRSRLNAILERKDNKDPYLPQGYQKGVLPKYLRERKEQATKDSGESASATNDEPVCPPGHVTLPDIERKETLRMLRNSFAELVNELNKMPVKTDTLRMRNRKMELEKQLAKLEEGIKVFSRPKVFVKIGE